MLHEVKGKLAKLLATENLLVEHKKVPTASFDVDRRVLTLPVWDRASGSVYDMLVGHEVGHALFTPNQDWREVIGSDVPKDFVNVIEDARIEKLMKRKYPGLARSFYTGYSELNEDDFFCISNEDLSTLSLIDRINLHFKIGAFSLIPFADDEQVFVDATENAETFDEVLAIAKDILDFINQRQKQEIPNTQNAQQGESENTDAEQSEQQQQETPQTSDSGDQSQESDGDDGEDDENDDADLDTPSYGGGADNAETESKTQRSFDENSEKLSNNHSWQNDTVYVEIPKVDLNNVIVDCQDLHDHIDKSFTEIAAERLKHWGNIFDEVDTAFSQFKKQIQKEVSYLVKEFECKKSADAYARQATSRTGVLDTKVLHTYKYNEDLFKKVTVLPDGKNHGMIFVLDWSGSMGNVLMDTVKQLISLCMFCKKVGIPFEVYAFTNEWNPMIFDPELTTFPRCHEKKSGQFEIHHTFRLLNFISSRTNSRQFDQQIKHVFRLAYYYRNHVAYHIPLGCDLSGTPLNESIIALHQIIPQFQTKNQLQKVNVVILTDGEGCNLQYNVASDYYHDGMGRRNVGADCALRDRNKGRVYRKFDSAYSNSLTAILLQNLQDHFPEVNIIGFRVLAGKEFNRTYRYMHDFNYGQDVPDTVTKVWKKDKSIEINPIGFNALYLLSSASLSEDTTFEVAEDATKAQIRKAFKEVLKSKTSNKKLLTSFASLVS